MIGATLGQKYTLVSLLGRGGMGSVYEAVHQETQERVAVKVLHSHTLEPSGESVRRFRREADAARAIQSDHIVRGLDAGVDEATGQLYLVTEHLDGEDLQRVLDRVGPLAPESALRIASQALMGLRDAHDANVIHRDIKPANMILARRPGGVRTVKLLDLGIAKLGARPGSLTDSTDLTTTGSFLGSPLYMSPEQVQSSRDVDPRTDIWSLGCVLYATLAGRAPHQHLSSIGKLLVSICVSPPPPLSEVAPWVPREIIDVVHRALHLEPDGRYPSARAMLDAIYDLVPSGALVEEMLAPINEQPRAVSTSSITRAPSPSTPRIVVTPNLDRPLRGDEATEAFAEGAGLRGSHGLHGLHGLQDRSPEPFHAATLRQAPEEGEPRAVARSAVPAIGEKTKGPNITVDPRRILGEKSELWTFSLHVHRDVSSLVVRIWKSLRRAGAAIPPRTYGTSWLLFEPRTGRALAVTGGEDAERLSLEAAGIRPGTVLWVIPPDAERSTSR